ncbi:MAG TPA: adenylate/guanylate cyclase domain-containing protein, partial [Acidimicrobiia bacterium]|nr:adenylate/guanylate cyclase domain-containing protein [Acidimicrobiia bacterium]
GRNTSTFPWNIDIAQAQRHYSPAEDILSARPVDSALGYVYCGQAGSDAWAVHTGDGLARSDRSLGIASEVGNDRLRRHAAALQGFHLASAGRLREAMTLLEEIWAEADAARDGTAAFTATWVAASQLFRLLDPLESRKWCQAELAGSRLSQAPYPRRMLQDVLGRAEALAGDLPAARRARDESGESRYAAPYIALCEGRFDEAAGLWEARRMDEHRSGNRHDEWADLTLLATVHRLQGRGEDAEARLLEALAISTDGAQRITEAWTRAELAVLLADAGRTDEARIHLARAQELTAGDEDWRGLHGRVTLAEAIVRAAEGQAAEARETYASAIEIFGRLGLVWGEADAHRRLGRAHLRAGDRTSAVRELAAALELYRRHGAGNAWIEPLVAEKLAAQGVDSSEVLTSVHLVAAAVDEERPDLAPLTSPEGTVTLLFSDIEGSTAANERLGDQRWMEVLRAHNQIVREEVARHGGFEVKSQGDGFMVAFSSARRGLASAVAIQRALRAHAEAHPDEATRVRMGLHTGEAVKEGDDFFGTHVALAARIAAAAVGGEILVSSLLKELTGGSGEFVFGPDRNIDLKGFSGSRRVSQLHWDDQPVERDGGDRDAGLSSMPHRRVTILVTAAEAARDGRLSEVVDGRAEIVPLDGVAAAAFASAADAVSSAVQLQRLQAPLAVGLHAGESPAAAATEGGPAEIARRLFDRAEPGQIVCSSVVARLLAGRPRFAFTALRPGAGDAPEPDGAFELCTETGAGSFPAPTTLIGRQADVSRLLQRIEQAAAGRGGLVMLAGEQGIGKTRLVEEIAV